MRWRCFARARSCCRSERRGAGLRGRSLATRGKAGGSRPRRPWPGRMVWRRPLHAAAAAARAYAARRCAPEVWVTWGAPAPLSFDRRMGLDASAVATLELFESADGSTSRSLFCLLDRTRTPLGARALRETLAHPSLDPVRARVALGRRGGARAPRRRGRGPPGGARRRRRPRAPLRADCRRDGGTAGSRGSGRRAQERRRRWPRRPRRCPAARLRWLVDTIPATRRLRVARRGDSRPRSSRSRSRRAGRSAEGADPELDDAARSAPRRARPPFSPSRPKSGGAPESRPSRSASTASSDTRWRSRNAHRDKVPADWIRKQSLANAERYVTPALKELEEKILGAEDRIARDRGPALRVAAVRARPGAGTGSPHGRRRSASSTSSPRFAEVARSRPLGAAAAFDDSPRL